MPRSEVVLSAGGAGGFTSRLLSGLAKRLQERRQSEEEQRRAIELLFETERAKQAFPSAEERLNRLRLGLAGLAFRQEPTATEIESSIPTSAQERLTRGEVAVPGPDGGVVMGRGEVAPGQPSSLDVLRRRLGEPRARVQLETERGRAQQALELLNRLGLGQRQTRTSQDKSLSDVVLSNLPSPEVNETPREYIRRLKRLGVDETTILQKVQQFAPDASLADVQTVR